MKKFELTQETKELNGRTFFRIVALVDIPDLSVIRAHKGGWLESESCLSHRGDCWVKDDAMIEEGSIVNGNAVVSGNAYVGNKSSVSLYAIVSGDSQVLKSNINEEALIDGSARVENSSIFGRATIQGNARITNSRIASEVIVEGNACIQESTMLGLERSQIFGDAIIKDIVITSAKPVKDLCIDDNAKVENVTISGNRVFIRHDASIKNSTIDGNDIVLVDFATILNGATLRNNCTIGGCTIIKLDGWGNELRDITLDTDMEVTMENFHLLT